MTVWPNGSRSIPRVTSEYGPRSPINTPGGTSGTFHAGIDLVGFPINKSPFAGRVIFAAYNGGAGNEVRIQAANGDVARIKHNARFLVSVGQWVAEGQDVGVMGTTGASTGVHCHFETWPGNRTHVNPRLYMGSTTAAGGGASAIIGKDNSMTHMFHRLGSSPTLYAIAGGSPGTPANWLETQDQQFANQLSAQIGASSAGLTPGSFDAWKAAYLAPVRVAGVTLDVGDIEVGASDPKVLAALEKIAAGQAELIKATKALNPPG